MALYSDWEKLAQIPRAQEEQRQFWESYFDEEARVYEKILDRKEEPYKGVLKDVAEELGLEPVVMAGFIDGANTSLAAGEYDLDSLTEESGISLEMDMEKLYYNMLDAKADWLYGLSQWDEILSKERRDEITKQFRKDKIYVAEKKVGRNEPCPCGSGKKYKNCHGRPGSEPLESAE